LLPASADIPTSEFFLEVIGAFDLRQTGRTPDIALQTGEDPIIEIGSVLSDFPRFSNRHAAFIGSFARDCH
jgi:hypothetical protein